MQLPIELAEAIASEAALQDRGALAKAVAAIAGRYRATGIRATGRLSDVERTAYFAVRMPAIYGALRAVFAELGARIPDALVRTVLDLGAGPGTAAWAVAATIPDLSEIACVELDRDLIAVGRRLASRSPSEAVRQARWVEADLRADSPLPAADLVVLSYVTGELESAAGLIERAWAATRIAMIAIEAGTPRGFATIRKARDQLIRAGAMIAAPCPHAGECPMKEPNWCHFAARIERTRLHRQLKSGELGHEDEKYSYVIASRVAAEKAESRVVRHPWFEPGLVRLELCAANGLETRTIRKRDGEAFRRARKAGWGSAWLNM